MKSADNTFDKHRDRRAVDANGHTINFRLPAYRDAKTSKAFLNKAIERVRLHQSVTIVTDKAHTSRRGSVTFM